jgi:hypothetical protein
MILFFGFHFFFCCRAPAGPWYEHITDAFKFPTIIDYDRGGNVKAAVFADLLKYLLKCASGYLQDCYGSGMWASIQYGIEFLLSHPDGWEGAQQSEMRRAAILAGLVPDTATGHARLSFVTEGEASLHFAIQNGLPTSAIRNGEGVVIVDAGVETIDISSYCKNVSGGSIDKFDEVAAPQREAFQITPQSSRLYSDGRN